MSNHPGKKQQKWCHCGSINHSRDTLKNSPVGIAIRKAKKLALGIGMSESEAKKAAEDEAAEEERKCLTGEAAWEGKNQIRGHEQEIWYTFWMLRQ